MGLKAIIVDNEPLLLHLMEKRLKEQSEIDVDLHLAGAFTNPYEALAFAHCEAVHLAFLDIEMPGINGFEMAERLLQIHPYLQIIFVTGYQEYAVKAFELNALDYLLKPVQQRRLSVTLKRIVEASTVKMAATHGNMHQATLCCLKSLHYRDDHGHVQTFPWRTLKAEELFAYLVHYRDKTVSKQTLIDLLWPEYDTARATTQLHTVIYQIRKILKTIGFDLEIKYKDEGYRLAWGALKLDAEEWENSVRKAPPVSAETLDHHVAIMGLYAGDFLEDHRYLWTEHEQERIRLIWLNHVKRIAAYYTVTGQYTEAILLYQKIRDHLPYLEDGYFGLMNSYAALNHQREVKKQFQLVSDKLEEEFEVTPSKALTDWYQQWEDGNG